MKKLLYLLLVMPSVISCSTTKYVAVPEYHTRDSIVLRWQHDSVFLHNSVFTSVQTVGDTVYKTKYVYRSQARQVLRIDTLRVEYTDTVTLYMTAQGTAEGVGNGGVGDFTQSEKEQHRGALCDLSRRIRVCRQSLGRVLLPD